MSGSKPNTLLSFVCNTTGSPAYRTEMHMDMRRAFQRFEVANGTAQNACFDIERAAYDLRTSSSDAPALLATNGSLYADAQKRMEEAPRVLFEELENEIVAMVLNPPNGNLTKELDPTGQSVGTVRGFGPISVSPSVNVSDNNGTTDPPPLRHLLLDYVYYFMHFKDARLAITADMSGVERAANEIEQWSDKIPRSSNGKPAVIQTLLDLGNLMAGTSGTSVTEAAVRPLAKALCDLLASEYEGRGWRKCW